MKYSIMALTALVLPTQTVLVQACDSNGSGLVTIAPEEEICSTWPSCTTWTTRDTAQTPTLEKVARVAAVADSEDVLVDEFDLTNLGEFARVYLEKGKIYRVEFSSQSGRLDIRPRDRSGQSLLPLTIEDLPRASGTRALEIAPRADGEYEFRADGVRGAGARIRIVREVTPSARWKRLSA
ncbi:MAG: hypothetical protein ABI679_13075 [Gemmatimonadota bacterium]